MATFSNPLTNRRRSVWFAAFPAAALGLVALSGSHGSATAGCITAYSVRTRHCTAIKGNLDTSRVGCARACHRAKAQCIATGCFGTEVRIYETLGEIETRSARARDTGAAG